MPSLHVDAPCSLLVPSCWLTTAGFFPKQSERTRQAQSSGPRGSYILSCARHHPTATAHRDGPPSSPLLTILARTRASLMRSRRGVWV